MNNYYDTNVRVWIDKHGAIRLKFGEKGVPMYVPKNSAMYKNLLDDFRQRSLAAQQAELIKKQQDCPHTNTSKEYLMGMGTGDRVCNDCGMTFAPKN
jgi:hypothetical protein